MNHKNLEYILAEIARQPGIKTTAVRQQLCKRNGIWCGPGQYTWYFSTSRSAWLKMGMDYGYWTKDAKCHLALTDAGFARLEEFKAKW